MKNQTTSSNRSKIGKSLAGLFVLTFLSIQLFAQSANNCNSHFYHQTNNTLVYFIGSVNHSGTVYAWTFGDGDTSSLHNPTHAYAASGAYYVCLTVTRRDTSGTLICTATNCDSVHFTLPPPPPPPVCDAHFTHHSFGNGSIDLDPAHNPAGSTYSWNYGDGSSSTVRDTVHGYAVAGTYYVCLTVTDADTAGNILCTSTWCDSVQASAAGTPPPPVCNAHYYHHNGFNSSVHFYGSHNSHGTMYSWNFGDGSTDSVAVTTHTYAPGNYSACLTVTKTDSAGAVLCTATWCDSIHVTPPPPPCNAHFSAGHRCHNHLDVQFHTAPNPQSVTYAWDFGDGSTSTMRNPLHTYSQSGVYNACLTVTNTDTAGVVICTATSCDTVHIDSVHVCNHPHHCWRTGTAPAPAMGTSVAASVYPNPLTETATLHIENTTGDVTLRIFETTGRLVSMKENLTNGDFELSKKELGTGLYFYQISDSNGGVVKGKLIVQ